jgi:hypothetical protein
MIHFVLSSIQEVELKAKPHPEIFTQSLQFLYTTIKKLSYYLNTESLIYGAGHR